ncbi:MULTISPECIES: hypothetical protein [Candidatus Cardinium]|uniref:hypothetical protein n=1 Tax=Candidatus Cardinium TaxID=273135 RepID=UPI001FA94BD2|nr:MULTISPECIES: hypothetical protein [Cardinium]
MSLLDNKSSKEDHLEIERFEKLLRQLLASYAECQKQIITLTEENKKLKHLLETSKSNLSTTPKNTLVALDQDLVRQINHYIKEIDLCLTYFEQT